MKYNDLVELVKRVTYPGHSWFVGTNGTNGFFVQLCYLEVDVDTIDGDPEEQKGRKWLVSEHAVAGEVFQTMLKAALTSAEHRIREHMLVDGVRVFGPHMPIEKLIEFVKANEEEHRAPLPSLILGATQVIIDPSAQTNTPIGKCDHGVVFDPAEASGLTTEEIRKRWPRGWGCAKGCGYQGISYASFEHYISGDW